MESGSGHTKYYLEPLFFSFVSPGITTPILTATIYARL